MTSRVRVPEELRRGGRDEAALCRGGARMSVGDRRNEMGDAGCDQVLAVPPVPLPGP